MDNTAANTGTGAGELLFEAADGIGLVTFNRPQARNALTFGMYQGLARICAGAEGQGLQALLITGAGGKAFAAGTDIAQFRDFKTADDGIQYEKTMDEVLSQIEACPVPTIAAISGACTGGGAAIAAVCDIRIATKDMKFGFPIARTLGNCLSITNVARLVALLGQARVTDLIFTARLMGAEQAFGCALVSELHDTDAALQTRARALAVEIAGHAPLTLRATKQMMLRLRHSQPAIDDTDLIALCYTSADFREGLQSFLAKKKPVFTGR